MHKFLYNLATDKYRGFIAGMIKFFLFLLSLIYGLIVRILILFYSLKPYRLNCKVIGIGNITLGGTGKTSLVEYTARYLKNQGHKIAILTRGYKRKANHYALPLMTYDRIGDEPYMLEMNLKDVPVLVNADRIRSARQAILNYAVDTVILDDAFQQWKLKKDLEIVTIAATGAFGNRHLIPRGILREPLSSLKRADIFVLTKTNLVSEVRDIRDFLTRINSSAQIFEAIHKPVGFYKLGRSDELLNIEILKGAQVCLVSGIGDPDSFENLITSLGINIGLSFRFPDHYAYTLKDLENIIKQSQKNNIDTIVTTEKDSVRFQGLQLTANSFRYLVLRIELKIIRDEEGFNSRLLSLYNP